MNYKMIFLSVLVSFSSSVYGVEVTNALSIKLQMKNSNFSGTPYNLSLPVCLSTDLRQSIPATSLMRTTGDSNPSPLPGIKYEKCQAGNAQQAFNFDGNKLISSQRTCLTRIGEPLIVNNLIREENKCSSTDGVTIGDSWSISLETNVQLQTCDDQNLNQKWKLEFFNNSFQLKAGNNRCLSMQGARVRGSVFYGRWSSPRTVWPGCPNYQFTTQGTLQRNTSNDSMGLRLDSCTNPTTEFQLGGDPIKIVEKVIPIIIPL